MKNLFILSALLLFSTPAFSQDAEISKEEYMSKCTQLVMEKGKKSQDQAAYICGNPYLEQREDETAQQKAWREESNKEFESWMDQATGDQTENDLPALNENRL